MRLVPHNATLSLSSQTGLTTDLRQIRPSGRNQEAQAESPTLLDAGRFVLQYRNGESIAVTGLRLCDLVLRLLPLRLTEFDNRAQYQVVP